MSHINFAGCRMLDYFSNFLLETSVHSDLCISLFSGRSLVKKAFVTFRTHSSAVLALDFSGQTRSFQERDESSPVKYVRLDIERYWDV